MTTITAMSLVVLSLSLLLSPSLAVPSNSNPAISPEAISQFPFPCIPISPSFTFSAPTVSTACPVGESGRDVTIKLDDGCTFLTFVVRFCQKMKPAKLVWEARRCVRMGLNACGVADNFFRCAFDLVEGCVGRERIVSAGAVA